MKNILLNSILNYINIIIPFVIIPIIIESKGLSVYGEVAYIQVVSGFCLVVVDYGFTSFGIKICNLYRKNLGNKDIFFCIVGVHVIIWVLFNIVAASYFLFFHKINVLWFVLSQLSALLAYIPSIQICYFYGIASFYSIINGIFKILYLVVVVCFIGRADGLDCMFVANFLTSFFVAIIVLVKLKNEIFKNFVIKISIISEMIKDLSPHFFRRVILLPAPVILSFYLKLNYESSLFACYSLADKVRIGVWQILSPIYSYFTKKIVMTANLEEKYTIFSRMYKIIIFISIAASVSSVLLYEYIFKKYLLERGYSGEFDVFFWIGGLLVVSNAIVGVYSSVRINFSNPGGRIMVGGYFVCMLLAVVFLMGAIFSGNYVGAVLSVVLQDILIIAFSVKAMAVKKVSQ